MADQPGFFKKLSDSEFGQLVSFGSNLSGVIRGIAAFISLFGESDTDKILGAIDQLRQDLDRDFKELGSLITQQTVIIVDTINRDAMATALSHTDTGNLRLQEFLTSQNTVALEAAKTESSLGVTFFINLGLADVDLPFFLPGLVKAGTIFILVNVAQQPNSAQLPAILEVIKRMISFLNRMIDDMKQKVDTAHRVNEKSRFIRCPPESLIVSPAVDRVVHVVDGFSHDEIVRSLDPGVPDRIVELEFIPVRKIEGATECESQDPQVVQDARAAADEARNQGVAAELDALGIPGYEEVLQFWKHTLINPNVSIENPPID